MNVRTITIGLPAASALALDDVAPRMQAAADTLRVRPDSLVGPQSSSTRIATEARGHRRRSPSRLAISRPTSSRTSAMMT